MYTPLVCIALRTVKLSDSKNLLSAWSRELGRVTFAVPAAVSREGRRRRALTAPLCVVEGVSDIRPGRDILSIRDVRALPASLALSPSPAKVVTAMFLAEALDVLLRRSQPDSTLSDFLFGSVEALAALDDARAVANFHLVFLFRLTHFAGIAPQLKDYRRGTLFDLREARFRSTAPLHADFLRGDECTVLMALSRADYASACHLPLDRYGRRRALDLVLSYYSLHLSPLASLKSLDVLREFGE